MFAEQRVNLMFSFHACLNSTVADSAEEIIRIFIILYYYQRYYQNTIKKFDSIDSIKF